MPGIRGCLSAMLKVLGHVGVLLSYIAGTYLNWRQSALLVAVAPSMLFMGTLFIPETPSYLVLNGKDDEAANSLQWLRGDHVDIRHELQVSIFPTGHFLLTRHRHTARVYFPRTIPRSNERYSFTAGDQDEHTGVQGEAVRINVQEQHVHASAVQTDRHHVRFDVLPTILRGERFQLLRCDNISADTGRNESSWSDDRDRIRAIVGFLVVRYDNRMSIVSV